MELPQRGTVPASGSWARRNSSVRRLASWRLVLDARTASSRPLRACMAWTTLSIWASADSGADATMSGPSARISRLSSVTRVAISRIRSRLGSSPVISRSIHASTAGCYGLAAVRARCRPHLPSAVMREAGEVAEVDGVDEDGQGAVRVPLLRLDPDLPLPAYAHPGDRKST